MEATRIMKINDLHHKNPRNEILLREVFGNALGWFGHIRAANIHFIKGKRLAKEIGDRQQELQFDMFYKEILLRNGRFDEAMELTVLLRKEKFIGRKQRTLKKEKEKPPDYLRKSTHNTYHLFSDDALRWIVHKRVYPNPDSTSSIAKIGTMNRSELLNLIIAFDDSVTFHEAMTLKWQHHMRSMNSDSLVAPPFCKRFPKI